MKKLLLALMMLGFMNVSYASNKEITLKQESQCCCKSCDTVDCCENCNDCQDCDCCESC